MTTLFDTSALIAVLKPADGNHQWSVDQLNACKANGPIVIVDVVYCELSVGMTKQQVDSTIANLAVDRLPSNDATLFRAGKAYLEYRRRPGVDKKSNVLPDFLIGAAAEAASISIVTANPKDFTSYFPNVTIIKPPTVAKVTQKAGKSL